MTWMNQTHLHRRKSRVTLHLLLIGNFQLLCVLCHFSLAFSCNEGFVMEFFVKAMLHSISQMSTDYY